MTTWMTDSRIPLLCLECGVEVGEIRIENGKPDIWLNPEKRNEERDGDARVLPNCGIELTVCDDCTFSSDGGLYDKARDDVYDDYGMSVEGFTELVTDLQQLGTRVKDMLLELQKDTENGKQNEENKIRKIRMRLARIRRKKQIKKLGGAVNDLDEQLHEVKEDFPELVDDEIPF